MEVEEDADIKCNHPMCKACLIAENLNKNEPENCYLCVGQFFARDYWPESERVAFRSLVDLRSHKLVVTHPFPHNDLSFSPQVEAGRQMPDSDPSVCLLLADLGDFLQQLQ
jgi:hypothetical protein